MVNINPKRNIYIFNLIFEITNIGDKMLKKEKIKMLFVIATILLFISGIFAGCLGVDESEAGKIRYGGQYYPEEFLLQGYDFWSKYDIDVEHTLFSSGSENNQALISGEVDINCGSDSKTVSLFNAMPDDVVIIGTIQKGDRYSTVVRADSDYQTWEDLKGKTVGTRLGTGAEQVLLRYFEIDENLSWDDFDWVNLNIEDMISALDAGTIEAFTAWEPTPGIAEAQGVGRILRTYGDIALVPVSLHTTLDYIKNHREDIVKFLAAHLDKTEMIETDPEGAAALAAQAASASGNEVSADAFLKIFGRINFSIDFNEEVLASINDTAQFLYDQGKIDSIPTIRADRSLLIEAMKLREGS
jgi:ABC-type nitrate/sulfonate/bicarbonate transport system substrate-binding protein